MSVKIAAAVLHGVGNQTENFADDFIRSVTAVFSDNVKKFQPAASPGLILLPVYWGDIFNDKETELWSNLASENDLHYDELRKFVISFFGDAIGYQPAEINPNYTRVHEILAETLHQLSIDAGPDAPLYVIGHSLGTVIASNYIYDLQNFRDLMSPIITRHNSNTPLENGKTLTSFFSLGSPLPLWSLRFAEFDRPIIVPSPDLPQHYPSLKGGWVNMYDKDDVLGYPLKPINSAYQVAVSEDIEVNSGSLLTSWTPLSHTSYLETSAIIDRIGESLAQGWLEANGLDKK